MNVQELFKLADKEDVFLSYLRRYDIIEPYDHTNSVEKEVEITKKFKKAMFNFIKRIRECEIPKEDTNELIFVIDVNNANFDDKQEKRFETFYVEKDEYRQKVKLNFGIWNNDTGITIKHYGYDFSDIEEVAKMDIAPLSIEKYGINTVCAIICGEMQSFNFGEDKIAKEQMFTELRESIKEYEEMPEEERKWYSAEEVIKHLKTRIKDDIEDENLKKYCEYEDEFEKKVKDIKDEWRDRKLAKNHEYIIQFLKDNYKK